MLDRQLNLTTKHVLGIGADRLVTSMDGDDGRRERRKQSLAREKAECSS